MDPQKIPFNALIVGPTNSGKTQLLVNQLRGPFRGKFDYIVLVCPTFAHKQQRYELREVQCSYNLVIVCGPPYRHKRVGDNSEANRHLSLLPRERCGYRSFLHSLSQNPKGHIRRLRGRTLHGRIQKSDFEAERAKVFPSSVLASTHIWN